ncbi:type I-G CRISPR-associated RAMP protein Csb1/Cas7g, partial [Schlesneria sp.]|uniref:type I-G CRISPR-associated RAMP protein Csb1/Cas7g n=1 Tax=Schlesneria sp. TaxID=2762018 RepID=UPI002F23D264
MSDMTQFDPWLTTDDFAALVIKESLEPIEGPDGVLFPATYAAAEDKKVFPGGYNIDPPDGEENVCLVDSVGSQANRIEPIFKKPEYAHLVPQIFVKAGEKSISILEAGHRAGDALVRCTPLQKELEEAFRAALKGNAEPLARIAPTSLVFGVWDSRNTQAKHPRLVASTIRAFNVKRLTRSAQYNPATDYIGEQLLEDTTDSTTRKAYSERGF